MPHYTITRESVEAAKAVFKDRMQRNNYTSDAFAAALDVLLELSLEERPQTDWRLQQRLNADNSVELIYTKGRYKLLYVCPFQWRLQWTDKHGTHRIDIPVSTSIIPVAQAWADEEIKKQERLRWQRDYPGIAGLGTEVCPTTEPEPLGSDW